jgi:hypothetical protein
MVSKKPNSSIGSATLLPSTPQPSEKSMTIKYPPSYLLQEIPQPSETTMKKHLTDMIVKYEMGDLEWRDTTALFQELIDNGMAWSLQGHYGRMANALIKAGYCEPKS